MSELIFLSAAFPAREGAPVIRAVDPAIFDLRYFARCMSCGFCADACCAHGVDVDGAVEQRLLAEAPAIEAHTGVPASEWFRGPAEADGEAPGGTLRRTAIRNGFCVFHRPNGRGCMLHSYAIVTGRDYHLLKPMVSTLFPLTFAEGSLVVSDELDEASLVCGGDGPTAYEACREEIRYYFGDQLVAELDALALARAPRTAAAEA